MAESRITRISPVIAMAILAAACSSDPKPPPETPVTTDQPTITADTTPKQAPSAEKSEPSGVSVDDRIMKMCSLPEARFDFDSASVSPQARGVLDALAKCFIDGPGKGKSMNIVGHADQRGETMYNYGLGERRAQSVGSYLVKAGLEQSRVGTSSRGELEATGTDEAGWSRDRRVEILLAE